MQALSLVLVVIALFLQPQTVLGQSGRPTEAYEDRERLVPPPYHDDGAAATQYRDDVPKWVPVVIMLIFGVSIGAVAIAFNEVHSKLIWAVGSVVFLTAVVGLVYLVFFVILGIPHN